MCVIPTTRYDDCRGYDTPAPNGRAHRRDEAKLRDINVCEAVQTQDTHYQLCEVHQHEVDQQTAREEEALRQAEDEQRTAAYVEQAEDEARAAAAKKRQAEEQRAADLFHRTEEDPSGYRDGPARSRGAESLQS
ncbi:hypothetical protein LTR86_010175 [Recurvomyces mirabilis]|nr:hypothetical protein LTR86_010175 [Recurvomyces mirabilis]